MNNQDGHWSQLPEQTAGYWHVRILLILFRFLPMVVIKILCYPVGFFYFVFSRQSREMSGLYLRRIQKDSPASRLRHIISFSITVIEKIESWGGAFPFKKLHFQNDDIAELIDHLEKGRGAFLVCSHLGNAELLRGLANFRKTGVSKNFPVISIIEMKVTDNFNKMLAELNPGVAQSVIGLDEIGPAAAEKLLTCIEAGGLVVMAGDRTSPSPDAKKTRLPFLGSEADFPLGPFLLAQLLKADVYFVYALRRGNISVAGHYDMFVEKCGISADCPRAERESRAREFSAAFVSSLEKHCQKEPFQWYNFYDFFAEGR